MNEADGRHNSTQEREEKIKTLTVLFSISSGGPIASETMTVYLHVLRNVPVNFVLAACGELMDTWTSEDHYGPPRPADVLKVARAHRKRIVVAERESEAIEGRRAIRARSLNPADARKLLAELAAKVLAKGGESE